SRAGAGPLVKTDPHAGDDRHHEQHRVEDQRGTDERNEEFATIALQRRAADAGAVGPSLLPAGGVCGLGAGFQQCRHQPWFFQYSTVPAWAFCTNSSAVTLPSIRSSA